VTTQFCFFVRLACFASATRHVKRDEQAAMNNRPIDAIRTLLAGLVGGSDTPFMQPRAQSDDFAAAFVTPPGVTIDAASLGGVPVEWITPEGIATARTFIHLHGGGYVLGNPAASRAFTTALARLAGCKVVSVDYRLAPEFPFPAAVDDALAVYRALLSEGHAPSSLAAGGESAGGGLALVLLLAAREAQLPMPASLVLVSPWTDLRCTSESLLSKAPVDPLLTRDVLRDMASAYLGDEPADNPLASPLLGRLEGIPPMLIHVGSEEVLLDDATGLARAAIASGANVTTEVWADMIHVFHMFNEVLPDGMQAMERLAAFLRQQWDQRGVA
jgi:epsilon-lactone hydrolase